MSAINWKDMSAINCPNARIYYKPIPGIAPGSMMHCRVMPKTIKIFTDLRNKQFKREPGAMTIHTPYPCPAEERLGYIVMSDNPVAERLVGTAMTYKHTIEATTDHQMDSWRMVETTTLPADCVSADGRPITKREEENNGRFIKRTMTTYTSGILQHKEVNLGDGLWFAIDTGTKEIWHYTSYESPCFCYEPMAGRFNVPINRGDENDPFVRNVPMTPEQVEHRAREAERIAQNIQPKEEPEEEPEEDQSDWDGFEACEWCGYWHHYEDKCPYGDRARLYEKWREDEEEEEKK